MFQKVRHSMRKTTETRIPAAACKSRFFFKQILLANIGQKPATNCKSLFTKIN